MIKQKKRFAKRKQRERRIKKEKHQRRLLRVQRAESPPQPAPTGLGFFIQQFWEKLKLDKALEKAGIVKGGIPFSAIFIIVLLMGIVGAASLHNLIRKSKKPRPCLPKVSPATGSKTRIWATALLLWERLLGARKQYCYLWPSIWLTGYAPFTFGLLNKPTALDSFTPKI